MISDDSCLNNLIKIIFIIPLFYFNNNQYFLFIRYLQRHKYILTIKYSQIYSISPSSPFLQITCAYSLQSPFMCFGHLNGLTDFQEGFFLKIIFLGKTRINISNRKHFVQEIRFQGFGTSQKLIFKFSFILFLKFGCSLCTSTFCSKISGRKILNKKKSLDIAIKINLNKYMYQSYTDPINIIYYDTHRPSFCPWGYLPNAQMVNSYMLPCPQLESQVMYPNPSTFCFLNQNNLDQFYQTSSERSINGAPLKTDQQVQCQPKQMGSISNETIENQECPRKVEEDQEGEVSEFLQRDLKSEPKNRTKKKRSQTKNLIKNYGRAILTFILRNHDLRKRVLKHLKIPDEQFQQIVRDFREEVHTISGSRYLWERHPYSQAFRILSCEFLRKHNLQHVFNSRIQKFGIYLKYQDKMMRCLKSPKEFESIKDF